MAATVHFQKEGAAFKSGAVTPLLYVSAAAVRDDASRKFVWLVVDDRVHRRSIECSPADSGLMLIRDGLAAGDRIVIDPPEDLKDNLPVKIVP
jgi:multidrug efflux pump subunit AcrA (membrane-fusion protein)